jgi:hypothetical protein
MMPRSDEFVGIGYKLMRPGDIGKFGVWQKAEHRYGRGLKSSPINADSGVKYIAGFHIFLNFDDALHYQTNKECMAVYKVEFKNVTAFGKNSVYGKIGNSIYDDGDCVIAHYIRYIKVLEKF